MRSLNLETVIGTLPESSAYPKKRFLLQSPPETLAALDELDGAREAELRFDVYHFDDTDPTADPESSLLRSRTYEVAVADDGEWHEILFDLPAALLAPEADLEANMILFYVGLEPPTTGKAVLLVDDVALMEWRAASDMADAFYVVDAVRAADGAGDVEVTLERLLE